MATLNKLNVSKDFTHLISYDLSKPGQNYEKLIQAIKELGETLHCLQSTWLVKTSMNSAKIRDLLMPHLDGNDKLIVASINFGGQQDIQAATAKLSFSSFY